MYFADTLYFTNNKGWSNVYAYAWNTANDKNAAWPGVKMDLFKFNEFNQPVYRIEGVSPYQNIIFTNNAGQQTVDIAAKTISQGNNAFYPSGDSSPFDVGAWYESGEMDYLNKSSQGLTILQCFNWSVSTIMDNLDDIASQGFTAIQTSPLQALKDYEWAQNDDNSNWWRFYQPVSFSVASDRDYKKTNLLINGDDELKALTTAAKSKGIRVFVDVVANHLADGNGNGGLHTDVAKFEPEIYNNTSVTLHNQGAGNDASIAGIVKGDITGKDLNTSNSIVQGRVAAYLKELIDDGVTGFRFDAAKHIETEYEQDECASDFWKNTLGVAQSYAANKNMPLFSYGEVLNPAGNTGKRSYAQYIRNGDYVGMDAVTDSGLSTDYRNNNGNYHAITLGSGCGEANAVAWSESHDDYMPSGDPATSHATWDQTAANDAYYGLARDHKDVNILYFPRPNFDAAIGSLDEHPEWGWNCSYIKEANSLHNGY